VPGNRLFVDIRPLKESPAFRRLWVGTTLSAIGSQMTSFAVALQIFTLTHSSLAVGAVGLAVAVPAIAFGLFGGSIVDVVDRRRMVLVTSGCLALVSTAFAAQSFAGSRAVWPLYCLVVVQSLLSCVNAPARRTFLARLLPADRVGAGAALTMVAWHGSVIAGPSLAGVLTSGWGLTACYVVDALSFVAALYSTFRLPPMPPLGDATRPGLRAVVGGVTFIAGNEVLTGALLSDLSATVLGMPVALFPAINAAHFGGTAQTLGLLTAAPSVGGVVGSALSGPVGRVSRHGLAMLVAGAVWGAGLVGFGLARGLWLALLMLVIAGAADALSVVFRTTMIQVATPDHQRGRVSAAEYVIGVGCPQLGNFRAGAIASLTSPAMSAVSGGLATIVGAAAIGVALPAFTRYQAGTPDSASP
jgi:MFS family permease